MSYIGASNSNTVELRHSRFRFTATEGQTVFNGNDANGQALANIDSGSSIFLNGSRLTIDGDYTIATNNQITLTSGAYLNDILEVYEISQVTIADVGGAVKRSGDILTGNLTAPSMAVSRGTQPATGDVLKRSDAPYLGTNSIIRTNAQNIAENITIDSSTNAMSAGTIQIDSGFTVTLNGEWTIV